MFKYPTIAELANFLDKGETEDDLIETADRSEKVERGKNRLRQRRKKEKGSAK